LTLDLTAKERVVLHLKDFQRHASDSYMPPEVTQKGISDSVGIRPSHVPRTLKRLRDEGMVEERSAHVRGSPRRLKVYFLSPQGLKAAVELTERVAKTSLSGGGTLGNAFAKERSGQAFWKFVRRFAGRAPEEEEEGAAEESFLGRKEELKAMVEFLRGPKAGALVVYGPRGVGKSTLVREALRASRAKSLSVDLGGAASRTELEKRIAGVLGGAGDDPSLGRRAADAAKVLFLDSYDELGDEVVDGVRAMVHEGIAAGLKVVVAAQETTPAYSRFYHNDEVRSGLVLEMRLRGLDAESGRTLLGTVGAEDYRKLDLYAKGSPLFLTLLKARDIEGLAKSSRFSREELKHLLFVYDQAVARASGGGAQEDRAPRPAVKL
jgi:DNA-binding MarR family transcriptional regulator